jgi:hypothetical protein
MLPTAVNAPSDCALAIGVKPRPPRDNTSTKTIILIHFMILVPQASYPTSGSIKL